MPRKNILLLVVAVVIALFTFAALRNRMQAPEGGPVASSSTQQILVARRDIPIGAFVSAANDLQWAPWPAESIQPFHIRQGSEEITSFEGAVSRRALKAGEPVAPATLIKPGSGGFLSAVLEPGKRAMSIAVTATTGNAGFIFPGDRVDLVVTRRLHVKATENGQEEESIVSQTFIEDVRVVAVDQSMDNPENKAVLAKTVTVEVSPKEAEKISMAEDLGKISIVLRSLGAAAPKSDVATAPAGDFINELEQARVSGVGVTTDSDLADSPDSTGSIAPRILVIRGDRAERRQFYVGGE